MATNEDLMHAIQETAAKIGSIDTKLDIHIKEEKPAMEQARLFVAAHGTEEMVRARISFVTVWMEREADRKRLRMKILESASIWAVLLMLGFLAYSVRDVVVDIIRADVLKATIPLK